MNISLMIALRYANPKSNKRFLSYVSFIALFSIALGSAALIISLAVLDGFERELHTNAIKFTSHIHMLSFRGTSLPNRNEILEQLPQAIPNIRAISAYIEREGIIRSRSFMDGILIKGIIPETDVTPLQKDIVEGDFAFSGADAYEVIIGRKLARKLNVTLGDNLVTYSFLEEPTPSTPPVVEQFKVVGIFATGLAEYDDLYAYIPLNVAASLFDTPADNATGFDIMLHDIARIDETVSHIENTLGYPYYPKTVYEMYSAMFAWIELQKEPIPLVLGLISIVAVFNIVATLLMMVVEKIHSIGVLRSLGMQRKQIRNVFLYQGLGIGVIGALLGCLLGFLACWLQGTYKIIELQGEHYFLDAVPIEFSLQHYVVVIAVCITLSFVATLIPSTIAARVPPLRALRFR